MKESEEKKGGRKKGRDEGRKEGRKEGRTGHLLKPHWGSEG